MLVIGLCGGSGAGKSAVAKALFSMGIPIIDADKVYRELTAKGSPLLSLIANSFGRSVIDNNGELNRAALAAVVFTDTNKDKLDELNKITHGAVIAEAERRIDAYSRVGASYAVFDAPLLFESGFDKKCDVVIAVVADERTRIKRITERDCIDEAMAKKRIASQKSDAFLKEHANYVIVNNGTEGELYESVLSVLEKIKKEVK